MSFKWEYENDGVGPHEMNLHHRLDENVSVLLGPSCLTFPFEADSVFPVLSMEDLGLCCVR